MRTFAILVSAAICSALAAHAAAQPGQRPNIVLVMADDLGWSDVGCYGGEIRTPSIDSLAQDGLRFTQFYNNAVCGPTRASLLTGLYCQQVGHRGTHWNDPKDHRKCVLVSELLQAAGYRTMMAGKWQGRDSALDRGFDRFFGPMCQGKISYFHEVQQNPYYLNRRRWEPPPEFYLTDAINEYSLRFLKEALGGSQPFFLYVAHIAPHWPLHSREAEIAAYRGQYREHGWSHWRDRRFARQRSTGLVPEHWQLASMPAGVGDWSKDPHPHWQAERMAVYAAQVEAIDRGLGKLLEAIKEAGQQDNTLIMFLSDNGAAPDGGIGPTSGGFGFAVSADNSRWRKDGVAIRPGSGPLNLPGPADTFAAYGLAWASVSNTPLRGTKLTAYEGGIRTPLVARWPGRIRSGSISSQIGHVIDIMPTCLEIAGIDYPAAHQERRPLPLAGRSLRPVLEGRSGAGHEVLCWSVPRDQAVRMGNWKALRPRKGGDWQLFDLEADGTETIDRAQDEPARVAELARQFEAWQRRVGDRN